MVAPDAVCDWDDCEHAFEDHAVRTTGGETYWVCAHAQCVCGDFAQPGSVHDMGVLERGA